MFRGSKKAAQQIVEQCERFVATQRMTALHRVGLNFLFNFSQVLRENCFNCPGRARHETTTFAVLGTCDKNLGIFLGTRSSVMQCCHVADQLVREQRAMTL